MHSRSHPQDRCLWFALLPAGTLLHSIFWLIAAAAVLEPITTLLLGLAEDDPLLLYWSRERRPQTRAAFLIALPAGLLLRALLTPWLGLLGDLIAFVYGFLLLARTLAVGWRFNTMTALVLAAAPALLILALAVALNEPVVSAASALVFIPLLWAATSDIRAQFRMDAAAEKLIAREKIAHEELTGLVRDVIRLRAAGAAGRLVEAENLPLATAQRIALLTAAGRHLEAVEIGSKALEAAESNRRAAPGDGGRHACAPTIPRTPLRTRRRPTILAATRRRWCCWLWPVTAWENGRAGQRPA